MAAALGAGLGLLLGLGTGYERQKMAQKHQADQAFLDLAVKNPGVFTADPKLLAEVKKRTSPEFADMLGAIGQGQAGFQKQLSGLVGAGSGGPSAGAGMQLAGGGVTPATTTQDPMTAHIAELDGKIQKLEQLMVSPEASNPANAPVVEHLKSLLSDLRQQRTQLTTEQYGQQRQERQFAQQEKMESQREAAAERHLEQMQGAAESREAARESAADRRERMREDFRDHLETLKDARTKAQQGKAFTTIMKGLATTRSSIEARANKAPDQASRQAEVDTFNSGIDALKFGLDDPEQIKQLDALKLSVGPATPGRIYGETPGTVTGGAGSGGDWADKYAK